MCCVPRSLKEAASMWCPDGEAVETGILIGWHGGEGSRRVGEGVASCRCCDPCEMKKMVACAVLAAFRCGRGRVDPATAQWELGEQRDARPSCPGSGAGRELIGGPCRLGSLHRAQAACFPHSRSSPPPRNGLVWGTSILTWSSCSTRRRKKQAVASSSWSARFDGRASSRRW